MREEIPQALCSLSLDVARGLRNNGLVPNPCYVLSSSSGDLCRAAPPHASEIASAKSGHLDEWEKWGAHAPHQMTSYDIKASNLPAPPSAHDDFLSTICHLEIHHCADKDSYTLCQPPSGRLRKSPSTPFWSFIDGVSACAQHAARSTPHTEWTLLSSALGISISKIERGKSRGPAVSRSLA